MRHSLFSSAAAFLLAAAAVPAFAAGPATPADSAPTAPKTLHSFDLTSIDKTADPCSDFYQYACGNWRKNNPIPGDQTRWNTFAQLAEHNNYLLYKQLEKASTHPENALQHQYGDFFAACMNTEQADTLGDKPVLPTLEAIHAISDKKQLAAFLGNPKFISSGFFNFGVQQDQKDSSKQIASLHQGGLTLPDRDYYLESDEHMTQIRAQYHDYLVTIFKLIGDTPELAEKGAQNVLTIETALAKASMPRVEMRDPANVYHPTQKDNLGSLTPDFDWNAFFQAVHPPQFTDVNVAQPDYFKAMNAVIDAQPLEVIQSYLRFHAVNEVAPYLSKDFDQASFNFFFKELRGQAVEQPRWKRCTQLTDRQLGEAVGQDWVKQNFPPQDKAAMETLIANLKSALGDDIQHLPWMSDNTKKEALGKLSDFRDKVGYPDKWRDYSGIEVTRKDFVADLHNASQFNDDWDLNHIGKPVDEKEWGMTPPTVNAYYDPPLNDINFPAGILQPPFYSQSADPAVNYGAIGVVIGHEMTHGFDDQGSKYDGHGNVRQWWTDEDRKQFEQRTDCEVNEYGNFEPVPGQKLNGKLTLGENTADNGGIRIAYAAMQKALAQDPGAAEKKIDGYTPDQRFFIAFAQVWCSSQTDAVARVMARTDPHSPGEFRANGTVQNFEKFGQAFGCHQGQPMMPQNACHVW